MLKKMSDQHTMLSNYFFDKRKRSSLPSGKLDRLALWVLSVHVLRPLFQRIVADGVFHAAGVFLGSFGIHTQNIGEEGFEHIVAIGNLLGQSLPLICEPDGAVGLLFHQTGLFEHIDRLIDGGLGNLQALCHLYRMYMGLFLQKLMNCLQIIFTGG